MKLKNILIVVEDIVKSKAFYRELFGLTAVVDFGGNVMLSEGLVLQERKAWEAAVGRETVPGGGDAELYFEEYHMDSFLEKLKNTRFPIEYINKCEKDSEGRRMLRIYDPDRHMIEIREIL